MCPYKQDFECVLGPKYAKTLSDSNGIRIHNHLVRKQTLNHLVKLAK